MFPAVSDSDWMCVCVFFNAITLEPFEIIMRFLWQQDVVKCWDDFENGCIPMHRGARGWWCNVCDVLVYTESQQLKHQLCVRRGLQLDDWCSEEMSPAVTRACRFGRWSGNAWIHQVTTTVTQFLQRQSTSSSSAAAAAATSNVEFNSIWHLQFFKTRTQHYNSMFPFLPFPYVVYFVADLGSDGTLYCFSASVSLPVFPFSEYCVIMICSLCISL